MIGEQKLEQKTGIFLFLILFIWFGWIGGYITFRFLSFIDYIFKTSFTFSRVALNLGVFFSSAVMILIVLFFDQKWKWKWKFNWEKALISMALGFAAIMVFSITTNWIMSLLREETISTNQVGVNAIGQESKLGQIILVAFFAPFVEEFLFRLGMIKFCGSTRFGVIFGVIASSLYFGFVHIDQALYQGNYIELVWLLYYGGAGLSFGLVYTYNKNIIPAILLHFLVNSSVFYNIMI